MKLDFTLFTNMASKFTIEISQQLHDIVSTENEPSQRWLAAGSDCIAQVFVILYPLYEFVELASQ